MKVLLIFLEQNFFKQQSGKHPVWEEIKSDDFVDMPFAPPVIPRAQIAFGKKTPTDIFAGKDKGRIKKSPHPEGELLHQIKNRFQYCNTSVDGKHPE